LEAELLEYRRLFFVFATLVNFTVAVGAVRADALSFNVTPMISDLTVAAGTSQTGLITVRDSAEAGSATLRLKVSMEDWTLDELGKPSFTASGTSTDSCAPWIQINPVELSVNPGQPEIVRYTVTVPATAQGSYHCIVFFTSAPLPSATMGSSVRVSGCIGNTVYVQVGPPVRRAKITALTITPKTVTITVQNTGSSYLRLAGEVKIASGSESNVVQQINIPRAVVLPGNNSKRVITINTSSDLGTGSYVVTAVLDYGGDVLLGARTNATLP
jgi:hypothetical protein